MFCTLYPMEEEMPLNLDSFRDDVDKSCVGDVLTILAKGMVCCISGSFATSEQYITRSIPGIHIFPVIPQHLKPDRDKKRDHMIYRYSELLCS